MDEKEEKLVTEEGILLMDSVIVGFQEDVTATVEDGNLIINVSN